MKQAQKALLLAVLIPLGLFWGKTPANAVVFSVGAGAEANGYATDVMAIGLSFGLSIELSSLFSIGVREIFSWDIANIDIASKVDEWYTVNELTAELRWFFLNSRGLLMNAWVLNSLKPYLQINAGGVGIRDGAAADGETDDNFPIVSLQLGLRFQSEGSFFVEAYGRYGLPTTWGAGVFFGARIEPDNRSPYL